LKLSPQHQSRLKLGDFRSGLRARLAVGLACLALLLQAMLPIAHVGLAGSRASEIPSWVLASICAVDPASSEDGQTGGVKGSAVERLSCPVCQAFQVGYELIPPNSVALRREAVVVSIGFLTLDLIERETLQRSPAQARAPPQTI
jgi:hypothetical protein